MKGTSPASLCRHAGLAELRRVLRPGGTLVPSWHGGREPSRFARSHTLPGADLDRVATALAGRFADVRRRSTRRCTVLSARRDGAEVPGVW